MEKKNRYGMYAVLLCNLVQMAMLGITPMLSLLPEVFPGQSITVLQLLVTYPNLVVVFVSLAAGKLAERVEKKRLMQTACVCFLAVALGGFFFHGSIRVLYLWSTLMGVGVGLIISTGSSLCSDLLEGEERSRMLGFQSTAAALGGVLLCAVGGWLSDICWYCAYLIYLGALPGLIAVSCLLPRGIYARPEGQGDAPVRITPRIVFLYAAIAFAVLSLCNAVPTNISLYLPEIGIQDTTTSGIAASVMQAGGALAGIVFGMYFKRMGEWLFPIAFGILTVGLFCILTGNLGLIMAGMFLVGYCMTTVMVCCSNGITLRERREAVTLGLAVLMAVANMGGFTASFYTNLSRWIFGSGETDLRFCLMAVLAAAMCAVTLLRSLLLRRKGA